MKIELLVFEGCPNAAPAQALLQECMEALGIREDIALISVDSPEAARRLAFPGSPTLRVDGVDVAPLPDGVEGSLTCRTYRVRGSLQGLPDKAWVMAALRGAGASSPGWVERPRTIWAAAGLGLLASACCWLPLALAGVGVAGGAAGAKMAWLRPWALGGLALLLAGLLGRWLHERFSSSPEQEDCCGVKRAKFPALPAAVLAISFLGAWSAPRFLDHSMAGAGAFEPLGGSFLVLSTPQYDCASCAGALPGQMSKTPGVLSVQMDFEHRETRIAFAAGADQRKILDHWNRDLGFSGTVSRRAP